jgi:hypothetical protein
MTRTQGRILAFVLAAAIFIVTQVVDSQETYGLHPAVTQTLVILNGVLALATNYLPNIFHSEPAPLPGDQT